jgi:hypothetical protein
VHIRLQFKDSEPDLLFKPNLVTYRAENFELGFIVGTEEALTFTFSSLTVHGTLNTHDEKVYGSLGIDSLLVDLTQSTLKDVPPSVLTGELKQAIHRGVNFVNHTLTSGVSFPQYKERNTTVCLDFNDNQVKLNTVYLQGELNIRRCPAEKVDEWEGPGKNAFMSVHY